MDFLQAVILGIVEGITEFLPVSSTGHLILSSHLLGIFESDFLKTFEIAIQLGAILAVVFLYWRKVVENKDIWKKVLTAFIPTAILGFIFYKLLKDVLMSNVYVVLWSLFLGGVFLIVFEVLYKKKTRDEISYKKSFAVGIAQTLAMIPGVSRSGATIVGGMLMGISRRAIVEFSFLLAVPTIVAATGYDLLNNASKFSFNQFFLLLVGCFVSFAVAIVAIKWLLHFVKNHTFISFGVYRIFLALLLWLIIR
ncbi:undecaprenyl-diphosphate phosphatase [Patescibacteria group bacterium]|nr:undecaprenyl-diphosphate phosphatase [Patescibacteria group bacterium]